MVAKRRRLLTYLRNISPERYRAVLRSWVSAARVSPRCREATGPKWIGHLSPRPRHFSAQVRPVPFGPVTPRVKSSLNIFYRPGIGIPDDVGGPEWFTLLK